jgi:nicotinate-nucleotide pyrophosphorylase (carboxylating)
MEREEKQIRRVIRQALAEDIGRGDVTSNWILPEGLQATGVLLAKAPGVVAGLQVVEWVFATVDPRIAMDAHVTNGEAVSPGSVLAHVRGPARSLLSAERVALNFMQRISGIATLTHRYVEAVRGTRAAILDTRKTVPGLRLLDKMAVRAGGGQNHRIGLYDMVLIKDNHIAAAGGISAAVQRVRQRNRRKLPIEVEVTNELQLREALDLKVERILLDNMSVEEMRQAVKLTAGRSKLEASVGVSLETVSAIARTGVDYISVGALTHSVQALDISLDLEAK